MSEFDLAQLRHAYFLLGNGHVRNARQFANGLIAPIIRHAERNQ